MSERLKAFLPLTLLAVLWLAAILLVDPRGDFPFTDDWAYLESVRALLSGEGVRFSDWTATNLVSQVFWGAGFAALFGVSPTVLRISTLAAALIGGFALYRLFRLAGATVALGLLAAVTFLFSPLVFSHAFSFMTDVPYAAFQLVAMWLLASGLLAGDRFRVGLGWLAGIAALLCRQTGLFIAIAAAGEAVLRKPFDLRRVMWAMAPVAAFAAIQAGYQHWLAASGRAPALYGRQIDSIATGLISHPGFTLMAAAQLLLFALLYLGLFALPVTLPAISAWRAALPEARRARAIWMAAISSLVLFGVSAATGLRFPMWGDGLNTFNGLGVEPVGTPLPLAVALVATALSCTGAVLLGAALAGAVATWRQRGAGPFDIAVFAGIAGAATLASVALVSMRMDRYLIPILPCVLLALSGLLAAHPPSRRAVACGFGAAAVIGLFSLGATHDYLAAKRAQWESYSRLAEAVGAEEVDGGWVINGAVMFDRMAEIGELSDHTTWTGFGAYAVGFEPKPGYTVLERKPIARWTPWNRDGAPLLVQKRTP